MAVAPLALLTGFAFHRVFGWDAVLVPSLIAATAALLLSGLLHRRRTPPVPVTLLAHVSAAVLLGCVGYAREQTAALLPTPTAVHTVVQSLADAPYGILSGVLPDPTSESLLLAPAFVWAAAAVGGEAAARTRSVALPALPATVLFVAACLLGTGAPGSMLVPTGAFVVAFALLLATRRPAPRAGQAVLAAALAPVCAAAALWGGASLPGSSRHAFDPRAYVDPPPPTVLRGPNPLDYVSAWLRQPETLLFTESPARSANAETLYRLATLERYDGATWYPVDRFLPSGGRVPPSAPEPHTTGPRVRQDITVHELTGVFLPAVERPLYFDGLGSDVIVDPDSGVLATTGVRHVGMRYSVVSRPGAHDPAKTEYAAAGTRVDALALPERDAAGNPVPAVAELRTYAQQATQGASFPYQQALRLVDWLHRHAVADTEAVPGHSVRHVQYFLGTSRRGTSEQFATAFALMARTLALPARVAVGFRGGEGDAGSWHVRGRHALVWAEVEFEGVGWVPFFPTPEPGGADLPPPPVPPSEAVPVPPPPAPPGGGGGADPGRSPFDQPHASAALPKAADHGLPLVALLAALAAALPTAYAVLALAVPVWLGKRRRRGPPDRRVRAAWRELGVELSYLGAAPPPSATALEVADLVRRRLGRRAGAAARDMARAVDAFTFGDRFPSEHDAVAFIRNLTEVRGTAKRVHRASLRARGRLVISKMRPSAIAATLKSSG
ncbi:DUF3488 and transglutaminase-like domain-containing protein (plasmid) [Streptomycetaceae bacterium NBC_01309]